MRHLPAVLIYVWAVVGLLFSVHPDHLLDDKLAAHFTALHALGYQLMFAIGILVHVVAVGIIPPDKPYFPQLPDGGEPPALDHSESIISR